MERERERTGVYGGIRLNCFRLLESSIVGLEQEWYAAVGVFSYFLL